MGTETSTIINGEYIANLFKVKLNNPLMGTETPNSSSKSYLNCFKNVKLNNPLMGTETLQYRLLSSLVLLSLN